MLRTQKGIFWFFGRWLTESKALLWPSVRCFRFRWLLGHHIKCGTIVLIYPKRNHIPATFTILNFPVDNLELAMDKPVGLGVNFEIYLEGNVKTGQKEGMYQWEKSKDGVVHGSYLQYFVSAWEFINYFQLYQYLRSCNTMYYVQ